MQAHASQQETVQMLTRHWVFVDALGELETEVKGPGRWAAVALLSIRVLGLGFRVQGSGFRV